MLTQASYIIRKLNVSMLIACGYVKLSKKQQSQKGIIEQMENDYELPNTTEMMKSLRPLQAWSI